MQGTAGLVYLAVLALAFYLLIIRPQMQRAKQVRQLIASLAIGERVVTVGGLHGTIVSLDDRTLGIEVSEGMTLTFDRNAVGRKLEAEADSDESVRS